LRSRTILQKCADQIIRRNLAMTLWAEICPDYEIKNRVVTSAYQPGERIEQFEKVVLISLIQQISVQSVVARFLRMAKLLRLPQPQCAAH
jgi:hypothetical protein